MSDVLENLDKGCVILKNNCSAKKIFSLGEILIMNFCILLLGLNVDRKVREVFILDQ